MTNDYVFDFSPSASKQEETINSIRDKGVEDEADFRAQIKCTKGWVAKQNCRKGKWSKK
jgi:hypothetical protein